MSLDETLDLALRLAKDEFESGFNFARFASRPITPEIEARAAEFGLTTYHSLLLWAFSTTSDDGRLDRPLGSEERSVLAEHANREFVEKLFPMLKVGSRQWQIWARDDEWDAWYARMEST